MSDSNARFTSSTILVPLAETSFLPSSVSSIYICTLRLTMNKIFPIGAAVNGIIVILSCTVIFHCLVLAGIIPFDIVWGGNLKDKTQLYIMEGVSIAINAIMLLIILTYSGLIKLSINRKFINGAIWFMLLLFLLNTFGNLLAKDSLETYIFTPLTFMLSIFCFRIVTFEYQQKKFTS